MRNSIDHAVVKRIEKMKKSKYTTHLDGRDEKGRFIQPYNPETGETGERIYFSEPQEIMKIQDIFVTGGSIFMNGNVVVCGKLESDIKLGDKIRIKETGKTYNISSILIKGKKLNRAKEGDSVGLELKFATKNSVKRGMTII